MWLLIHAGIKINLMLVKGAPGDLQAVRVTEEVAPFSTK